MYNYNLPQYSLILGTNRWVEEVIAEFKRQLYAVHGWFGSYRSLAHISIDGFSTDADTLNLIRTALIDFAAEMRNHNLIFNSFSTFDSSRTLYVAPDSTSAIWLNDFAKRYFYFFCREHLTQHFNPHITIGRKIEPQKFDLAKRVFANQIIHLPFVCNNITLRKFDPVSKQYVVKERFYFGTGANGSL